ncbi:hypothetical protein ONZ45_g5332 [Pleurotus djamor]|nr:hypothetical protein ONZ45_g5332 [Pleurotus djamor]
MMVATASPAAQITDAERRRKLTMDRAKANHLSRQLQLRLQYAKLKIEHGWQKQSLNEVENLYFRHSQVHGPKPQNISAPVVATAPAPTPTLASEQSAMSFKLGSTSFTISSSRNEDTTEKPASTPSTMQTGETRILDIAVQTPSTSALSAPTPSIPAVRHVYSKPAQALRPQPTEIITHPSNPYPAPRQSPPLSKSSSSSLYYRSTTLSSSGTKTSEPLRFSSSSLTYDSFWSSMASTSSGSSARASTSSSGHGDPQVLIPAATIVQGGYRRSNGSRMQDKES